MNWTISTQDKKYLRELAKKQAEYAALPIMQKRKEMWYNLNDGKDTSRPPVIIETWTFDRDFMPPGVFKCTSEPARSIEWQLLRNIRNHELIDDDKVITDVFSIGWFVEIDEFGGIQIKYESVKDAEGVNLGYKWEHPIKDLKKDLNLLKPAKAVVDKKKTMEWKAFLEDLFDGILKVKISTGTYGCAMLTHRVVSLMGMEAFFTAMYDTPDEVHRLMAYLRDNCLLLMHWAEAEGLLMPNNENESSFGSSYNWTTKLPLSDYVPGKPCRLKDMWGCANSQETVGVSPEMFHEFCFPYYRDCCKPLGLLYYGCCEPVHPFWDDISKLPHLKKVSISKWCNEAFIADALRGTEIVYSRKPDPNFLSVDTKLNEEAWAEHIRKTLKVTKGVFTEFIVRDVYTVHDNLNNAKRAVEIARREIEHSRR